MNFQIKYISNQIIIICCSLFILSGCGIPDKPEGADIEGFARIGDKLKNHNDDEGAASFYNRSLAQKPDDSATRIKLAALYEAHGNLKAAELEYREGLLKNPDDTELLRNLGRNLLKQGQPLEAKSLYEKVLNRNPTDIKALNGLGIALDYLGNHSAAQKIYKEALADKQDDVLTINNLGHSLVLVGAYSQAIALLEPHINDADATPSLRQNLAEAYGLAGMTADAERMGLKDLNTDQVKRNLDIYHSERKQLALEPKYYVYLGTYATREMAEARAKLIRDQVDIEEQGLVIEIAPDVKVMGGTPTFPLIIKGFSGADKTKIFCEKLVKKDIACKCVND